MNTTNLKNDYIINPELKKQGQELLKIFHKLSQQDKQKFFYVMKGVELISDEREKQKEFLCTPENYF